MARKVTGYVKLQIQAGKATPAPPVGPALGQHGVNIMGFCKKKAAKLEKGSAVPNKTKVAKVSVEEVRKIAEIKMSDLNAATIEAAISMVKGTARSMGIVVEG